MRAIVATQNALKADVTLVAQVGHKLFPPREANLITGIVERDLPYNDASIASATVNNLNEFCRARQILKGNPAFEAMVEPSVIRLWKS